MTLPDAVIRDDAAVSEFFETDIDGTACENNPHKIGSDTDRKPGGCDNVQVRISAGTVKARYARLSD